MALKGYQFDREKLTAAGDSSKNSLLCNDKCFVVKNRGNELNVTTSGLDATLDTGTAMILGRVVEVTSPETISIEANTSGFLVIKIDLSARNESSGTPGSEDYMVINNQVKLDFVSTLTQQDLNNGGLIYTLNLGTLSSTASTLTYTKNEEVYNNSFIFPDGATFGESVSSFDSAILGNRWYSGGDNLYLEPASGKEVIIRQKDSTSNYLPLKAYDLTLTRTPQSSTITGQFGHSFFKSTSKITFRKKGNVCELDIDLGFNAIVQPQGLGSMGDISFPSWALPNMDKTLFATALNTTNGRQVSMWFSLTASSATGVIAWKNEAHGEHEYLRATLTYIV